MRDGQTERGTATAKKKAAIAVGVALACEPIKRRGPGRGNADAGRGCQAKEREWQMGQEPGERRRVKLIAIFSLCSLLNLLY